MEKIPLPRKYSKEDAETATHILAVNLAHTLTESCEELSGGEPITADLILMDICGCDSDGNDRDPDDLDGVEREAYTILCAHFGVEARAI